MFSNRIGLKPKDSKKDLAPIGFFFDVVINENFITPILPVPLRIDKVIKGEPTLFILPNQDKIFEACKKYDYYFNFKKFIFSGIINLIHYLKQNLKLFNLTALNKAKILEWYHRSILLEAEIIDLRKDFTYLIIEFIKLYSKVKELDLKKGNTEYAQLLLNYCEKMINYFKSRLENNSIKLRHHGVIIEEILYFEKRGKYFPSILSLQVNDYNKKGVRSTMCFVPYLIYDDIIDVFYYNQIVIKNTMKSQINLNVFENNKIIIKGSKIDNNIKKDLKTIEIELEKIL